MAISTSTHSQDAFMQSFKGYKRRKPPPDLANVIDFRAGDISHAFDRKIERVVLSDDSPLPSADLGLLPSTFWKCFTFTDKPGFMYIENPFTPACQKQWLNRCIRDFPHHPNITNLSQLVSTGDCASSGDRVKCLARGQLTLESNDIQIHHSILSGYSARHDLKKLRWTTLGYHYGWDNKSYKKTHHTPIPTDLTRLGHYIGAVVGYPDYHPEAVIVNRYHLGSTLAGHSDHSEEDLVSPIISISLGQDAIFLLGGLTKDEDPTAMFVRSGDIIVMGGESRLMYHALPKVIQSPAASSAWRSSSKPGVTFTGTQMGDFAHEHKMGCFNAGDKDIRNSEKCGIGRGCVDNDCDVKNSVKTQEEVSMNTSPCKMPCDKGATRTSSDCIGDYIGGNSCASCSKYEVSQVTHPLVDGHLFSDEDLEEYMEVSRINISIRQVYKNSNT